MTKRQKIWLWVFLVMFIVPEATWGPVLGGINFFIHTKFRPIILNSGSGLLSYAILLIEFVGAIGLLRLNNKRNNKGQFLLQLFNIALILILLVLSFVLYISLSFNGI